MNKDQFIKEAKEEIEERLCFEQDYTHHDGFLMDYPEIIGGEFTWDIYLNLLRTAYVEVHWDE